MPDKVAIHLPSMLTRKSVYDRMKQERVECASLVSQSQFYALWSKHYPHVSIPAVSIDGSFDNPCNGDSCEGWLSLVCGLQAKKLSPADYRAPPVMSNQIMKACAKDRQPIPEVCRTTSLV